MTTQCILHKIKLCLAPGEVISPQHQICADSSQKNKAWFKTRRMQMQAPGTLPFKSSPLHNDPNKMSVPAALATSPLLSWQSWAQRIGPPVCKAPCDVQIKGGQGNPNSFHPFLTSPQKWLESSCLARLVWILTMSSSFPGALKFIIF